MASEASQPEAPLRRLHSLSWIFLIGAQTRALLLPAIVFLFAGGGSPFRLLLLLFLIPATIQPLFVYFSYRYQLRADEIVVRQGVLFRNERRIPYSRIQNVDLVQNPLHRIARVAVVRLETASGGKPEAVMKVLSLDAIQELRKRVRSDPTASEAELSAAGDLGNHEREAAPSQEPASTLLRMRPIELVKLGLISNQGMVVVAAASAFFFQQNMIDWSEVVEWENMAWVERVPGLPWVRDAVLDLFAGTAADRSNWLTGVLLVAAGVISLLTALYLFSIALAFFRFYGFTLRLQGNFMRAEYGLLTRIAQTTPRQRIQHLLIHQGPLHRLFRRTSIRIDTAGGGGTGEPWQSGGSGASRQWLAPLIRGPAARELTHQALPEVELARLEAEASEWKPIAQRAWKRRFRARAVVLLVLGGALSFFSLWALAVPALGLPLQLLLARKYVSSRRYCYTDQAILWQRGWWGRDLSIVRFGKIQAVRLARSPFDRRHRMAAVLIDTAGARPGSHAVYIPYLELEVAQELCQRLHREASGRAFVWA